MSEAVYPKFATLIKSAPELEHVIVSGDEAHGFDRFEDVIANAKADAYTAPTTRDDMCFWLYTSGTTGRPKGTVHVHADLKLTNDLYARPILGLTKRDVCYSVAKLFFAYVSAMRSPSRLPLARPRSSAGPSYTGCGGGTHPHASLERVLRGADLRSGFRREPAAPQRSEVKLRLCVSAGEALPRKSAGDGCERHGVDILDGIGSTEMLHIFLSNRPGDVKYGTSGKPLPGYDIRLVDDDGQVVKKGEMGELEVRGPTSAIMYWNKHEKSRATFIGEGTRSGDKYIEDEAGYIVYCGRSDDMLKVGGIYVSPFEVEGVLSTYPDVLEAAVVGWRDENGLIKPKALVVLKSPDKASDALAHTLEEYCRTKLAHYKYPRWIEFRKSLPKTATEKI